MAKAPKLTRENYLMDALTRLENRQLVFEDKILAGDLTPELFEYCRLAAESYACEAVKLRALLVEEQGVTPERLVLTTPDMESFA